MTPRERQIAELCAKLPCPSCGNPDSPLGKHDCRDAPTFWRTNCWSPADAYDFSLDELDHDELDGVICSSAAVVPLRPLEVVDRGDGRLEVRHDGQVVVSQAADGKWQRYELRSDSS